MKDKVAHGEEVVKVLKGGIDYWMLAATMAQLPKGRL